MRNRIPILTICVLAVMLAASGLTKGGMSRADTQPGFSLPVQVKGQSPTRVPTGGPGPVARLPRPTADFSIRITRVSYITLQRIRNQDGPGSQEAGLHEIRVFWEFPDLKCFNRPPESRVDLFAELTLPNGRRLSRIVRLDASRDCSGRNCSSTVLVGGSPTDARPRSFDINIRGSINGQAVASGRRQQGTGPSSGQGITIPPGAVSRDTEVTIRPGAVSTPPRPAASATLPLEITDVRFTRGQIGGPELRVFWKLPSAKCFNKNFTFEANLSARLSFVNSEGARQDVTRTERLSPSRDCSGVNCSSTVRIPAPSALGDARAINLSINATGTLRVQGYGESKGSL